MLIKETWGHYLQERLIKNEDKIAVIDISEHTRYTYRDLLYKSKMIEKALIGSNITRGTHVALVFPNSATWIAIFMALINIGAVPVCLNNENIEEEILYEIKYADARVVITDEATYTKIRCNEVEMGLDLVVLVDRQGQCSQGIHISFKTFYKKW